MGSRVRHHGMTGADSLVVDIVVSAMGMDGAREGGERGSGCALRLRYRFLCGSDAPVKRRSR